MTAKDWLQKAQDEGFAIGAFNVGNLETFKAIVAAAVAKRSPILIESSPGETKWIGAANIADIAENYSQEMGIPIIVNLDHSETLEDCRMGITAGYELIHFDGHELSLEDNIAVTKIVVTEARAKGLFVEGEIDKMARKSSEAYKDALTEEEIKSGYTKPERAKEFVEKAGVDTFAAFFGNSHGTYPGGQPPLNLELLAELRKVLPNTFLSMHGGSGIEAKQVAEAIKVGKIVKINVNTDLRVAWRSGVEEAFKNNPDALALYKIFPPAIKRVQDVVECWIDICGSANKI